MRLRIQTQNPLPPLKAWFTPDVQETPETIHDLKENLCREVHVLKNGALKAEQLTLLLDGFELLDDTPFDTVVRDGDLICIKSRPLDRTANFKAALGGKQEGPRGLKRKRSISVREPTASSSKKHVVKRAESPEDSSSESDSSSSSSSSSSSLSSSSSSSSTSSSSSSSSTSTSSSSSTSSSPPKPQPSKPPITVASKSIPTSGQTATYHTPPGFGKPATHSRNQRRRKKRELEKAAALAANAPPKGSSDANSLPLGQPRTRNEPAATGPVVQSTPTPVPQPARIEDVQENTPIRSEDASSRSTPVYITKDQVMMGSLRNKNKKKGFKLSMANPIPQKIVFSAESSAGTAPKDIAAQNEPPAPAMDVDSSPQRPPQKAARPPPRLIPPSELQDAGLLPPNMFVTSVDVEAGMCDNVTAEQQSSNKRKNRKKAAKSRNEDEYYTQDDWYAQDESFAEDYSSVALPYSEVEADSNGRHPSTSDQFDWEKAELAWDKSAVVSSSEQLVIGAIVGWKELAMNPQTLSPEFLLSAAKIIRVEAPTTPTPSGHQISVAVRAIPRSGSSQAALSFGLAGGWDADGEGEGSLGEEEILAWAEGMEPQWRILKGLN